MNLTIFAATGRIGRLLLEEARAAGHEVTAVARDPNSLPSGVRTITADLLHPDPATMERAVDGADAVLSGLGPRSKKEYGITSRGTRAILEAMKETGTRRIVVVSAAPVSTTASPGRPHPPKYDPGERFWMRHLLTPGIKTFLHAHYADLAVMEDMLRDSGLDWTVIRPPKLTDKTVTGTYRTAYEQNLPHGVSVSRADVAHVMLDVVTRRESVAHAMGVAS